jgi:hypothetical protein
MKPRFGPDYYARYYGSPRTRVVDAASVAHLARGVTSLKAWWGAPLRTVLDVGAGVGHWGRWFRRHRPEVRYRSTEISRHACDRYGHELRDISRWRDRARHDLVVCQGVLPYLDDEACARAIDNLAAMSGGFLYLEAITRADLRDVCDTSLTDVDVHARSARFYERHLAPHYVKVGAGLWYARSGRLRFFDLERGSL